MFIDGVKCEICDKIDRHMPGEQLPEGWLSLDPGRGKGRLLHFCSLRCLNQWIKSNLTANDIRFSDFYR